MRSSGFSDEWMLSLLEDIADIHMGGLSKLMLDPLVFIWRTIHHIYPRIVDKNVRRYKSVSGDILLPTLLPRRI